MPDSVAVAHLLLIDDDTAVVPHQIQHVFADDKLVVAATGAAGIEHVRRDPPDAVLLDLRLPDASGLEVYSAIRALDARIPVIFITTAKHADTAIEAMKRGAYDYLYKPLDFDQVHRVVHQALEVSRLRAPVAIAPDEPGDSAIVGTSQAMLEVFKAIGRVAAHDVTVLITGESGTGKELVARAIYQHSARASLPFLALNCAAIPEPLLESELFGHEKGAFTGADRRRIGKFEQCHGGTILLDEIGDMPAALQAKILRVLQDQAFERVGGNETIRTDVRVIAATHRDLGTHPGFRADLYYRLSVFGIHLPPLRERPGDIPVLAAHFLRRFGRELGRDVAQLAPATLARLTEHAWPGNIRELQSVLRRALLQASGAVLLPDFLPPLAAAAAPAAAGPELDIVGFIRGRLARETTELSAETHREIDRVLLALVLDHTRGSLREAARVLGISRQTLRGRLRAVGLSVTHTIELEDAD